MTILADPTTSTTLLARLPERRVLLDEQRRQQVAAVVELAYDALTLAHDAGDGHNDGSRVSELLVTSRLLAGARQQLVETEAALARLDDGTYGLCADCTRGINPERLEILPAAQYCVACQADRSCRR
jgi:DnaK suppressor protein